MNDVRFWICQELNEVRSPWAFADVDDGLEAVQSRAPYRRGPPTTLPFAVNLLHSMCRQPALLPGPAISFVALFFFFFTSIRDVGKKASISVQKLQSLQSNAGQKNQNNGADTVGIRTACFLQGGFPRPTCADN